MKPETKRYVTIGGVTAILALLLQFINTYTSTYFDSMSNVIQLIGFSFLYDFITVGAVVSLAIYIGDKITKEKYSDFFADTVFAYIITFVGVFAYYFFLFAFPNSFLTHPVADVVVVVLFSLAFVAADN